MDDTYIKGNLQDIVMEFELTIKTPLHSLKQFHIQKSRNYSILC